MLLRYACGIAVLLMGGLLFDLFGFFVKSGYQSEAFLVILCMAKAKIHI
jgi:hypothetical protein